MRVDDVFGLDAVAGSEHRNRDRPRDLGDEVPIGKAAVALLRGAAVNRDRLRARVLDAPRQLAAFTSPSSHPLRILTVTGIFTAFDIAAMIVGGMRRLAHQAAAGVVLRDLRHRAAHVDVDDVGAHLLDDARGFGHLRGLAAEDLNRDGTLFLGVFGVLERAIDAANQAFAADHFGHHEPAAALALHQAAKRGVGHARHRRDDKRRFEFDGTDLHVLDSGYRHQAI